MTEEIYVLLLFALPRPPQSGGPWIKPEQSMRYLASSELLVTGGQLLNTPFPKPTGVFQDVRVIAFKAPENYRISFASFQPRISATVPLSATHTLLDGDLATPAVSLPAQDSVLVDLSTTTPFTARSLVLYPAHQSMKMDVRLAARDGKGEYKTLKRFVVDRRNQELNVGFTPFGPVAISIPATTSTHFRLTFSTISSNAGLTEIQLLASPCVENYIEKTLAKMHPTPFPYWQEYQWAAQPAVADKKLLIDPASVLEISSTEAGSISSFLSATAG